jgi:AcrR family transcriptional regulator
MGALSTVAPAREHDREQLASIQRKRILAGMFAAVAERGAAGTSVADVVARSGVSRRTFYEAFADREDCLAAALREALAAAAERVLPAYRAPTRWHERIRAGLRELLCFLEEQPAAARLLLVESLGAGAEALALRTHVTARLVEAVEEGRELGRGGAELPALTGEGAVGGVVSILQRTIATPGHPPLIDLLNPLMAMLTLPYLGPAAARRELDRPVPPPVRAPQALAPNAFKDAGVRLTYRTIRVLLAVADHPGASNRLLGQAAEIADQGQISKLLKRLQTHGLIENGGAGHSKGAPNAWRLTELGSQISRGIPRTPATAGITAVSS